MELFLQPQAEDPRRRPAGRPDPRSRSRGQGPRRARGCGDLKLDAILYPLQKILVVPITAADQTERNGTLSNGTGFPAVTFPGGFSAPGPTAPIGVPVGAELLGLDYSEDRLLSYAYAYEQATHPRQSPPATPRLPNEP